MLVPADAMTMMVAAMACPHRSFPRFKKLPILSNGWLHAQTTFISPFGFAMIYMYSCS